MAENRFHELLGLPEEVSDPDHYQLLGIARSVMDPEAIEARFKEQMTRVQHIENPRHKEFLEFLKGELKRARAILTDESRRQEYDKELAEERGEELRKVLSHMLVDGTLSSIAEISVIQEGRNLGLEGTYIRRVVDEELQKAGAKRVSANTNGNGHETQFVMNKKAQEIARQVQDARMAARLADTRARIAESHKKKAEEQVAVVMQKARQAELGTKKAEQQVKAVLQVARQAEVHKQKAEQQVQAFTKKARDAEVMARRAINDKHLASAKSRMSEQERKKLEEVVASMEASIDAANEEIESVGLQATRWERMAISYAFLFFAIVSGGGLSKVAPGLADPLRKALDSALARVPGPLPHAAIPLIGVVVLLVPMHLLAGKKAPVYFAPLVAAVALALAAGVLVR